jgi:hypothetical protein
MEPIVNGLKKAYIGRVKVVRIDREDPENVEIVESELKLTKSQCQAQSKFLR